MNPLDWLKNHRREEYVKGQEAVAKEVATERFEDQQVLTQRVAKAAAETIDLADELAADGNPHKRQLAELIRDSVFGAVERVATGDAPLEERRAVIEEHPFSENSKPLETSSSVSTPALPHEPTEPPKRKRGRPPKHLKP